MRFLFYFFLTLPLFIPFESGATDLNGYTALYECRAGGPRCDVDVVKLGKRTCDQIITASTKPIFNWSAINWSNDTICIGPGNHIKRGKLEVTTSGLSGEWKVLRYTSNGDKDTDPWNQSDTECYVIPSYRSYTL